MPNYKEWTEHEIRDWMTAMDFKEIKISGTKELVFEHPTKNKEVRIRVYTSIEPGATSARAVGTDAGRVVLIVNGSNVPVWKATRTHRTENFLVNLRAKCRLAWKAVQHLKTCPKCGGFMVERKKHHGPRGQKAAFLGCLQFPACRGTRSL